jgi:hypothetical protein
LRSSRDLPVDVLAIGTRAGDLRNDLAFILQADDQAYVYYLEVRGRGVFLRASPIDVSNIVRELLLDRMKTTVLTSATLTVDGSFEYVRGRLGIRDAHEVLLRSEFDYRRQSILYLPKRMPDPRSPEFGIRGGARGGRHRQADARTRVRAVHELREPARGAGPRRVGDRVSDPRPGIGAALGAAARVQGDAERRVARDLLLLARRRRRGRGVELRDHR